MFRVYFVFKETLLSPTSLFMMCNSQLWLPMQCHSYDYFGDYTCTHARSHTPVETVAVVGVDGENSETGFNDGAIVGTVEDGAGHFRWQPLLPKQCNLIIQPRNVKLVVNVGLRVPGEREQGGK